jgi:hypothetical protein
MLPARSRSHQLAEDFKDLTELCVVLSKSGARLSLELLKSLLDGNVGGCGSAQVNKRLMIATLTLAARLLRRTPDSIATPCSVNA